MTTRSPGSRTVLMCGGPADGRWVTVESPGRDWECSTLPRVQWTPEVIDTNVPEPHRTLYRIMPLAILGHQMWVGVALDDAYDDRAIMKAVLNRDVAAHLGAYR